MEPGGPGLRRPALRGGSHGAGPLVSAGVPRRVRPDHPRGRGHAHRGHAPDRRCPARLPLRAVPQHRLPRERSGRRAGQPQLFALQRPHGAVDLRHHGQARGRRHGLAVDPREHPARRRAGGARSRGGVPPARLRPPRPLPVPGGRLRRHPADVHDPDDPLPPGPCRRDHAVSRGRARDLRVLPRTRAPGRGRLADHRVLLAGRPQHARRLGGHGRTAYGGDDRDRGP